MKFNIEVECTRVEARSFLGLSNGFSTLQERPLAQVEAQMSDALKGMAPEAMLKTLFRPAWKDSTRYRKRSGPSSAAMERNSLRYR